MKNLRTSLLCAGVALISLCSSAQTKGIAINEPNYDKAKLFQNLPNTVSLTVDKLNTLLNKPVGNAVNVDFSDNASFHLEGQVISMATQPDGKLQTTVIRSSNFKGANLTISRVTHEDGTISYTGRLISFKSGDLFELQTRNGQLMLVKRNYNDLVNE
jgi:hypothetical protein